MSIYQHFREDEHPFIDYVLSVKEMVLRSYRFHLTDFLNPREQQMLVMVIGEKNPDLQVHFFGGRSHTERNRAIIAPFYDQIEHDDFELTLLQASYAKKFVTLEHRDIMGAFLSLGVTRQKLGDIFVGDGKLQIVTSTDIAPFIIAHLMKIKNANIQLQEADVAQLQETEETWKEKDHYVSSMRLDAVIKEIYRLSRKLASLHIGREHVKVNFKTVNDPKYAIFEGDLISIRGLGRSKVLTVHEGVTRKGRIRMTAGTLD